MVAVAAGEDPLPEVPVSRINAVSGVKTGSVRCAFPGTLLVPNGSK
ncbi:hypothetical protein SAMN05216404_10640 [Nitrosospira multiformis]|uniref:Uncharacterized protein n=1 Tax=Nitrosospira multiformis TaxID=1231 RepID=A0A1H8IBI8_9PROT|nr:hypothetical protein SAMN05216404_10640 [Nitrosospira multiformis]